MNKIRLVSVTLSLLVIVLGVSAFAQAQTSTTSTGIATTTTIITPTTVSNASFFVRAMVVIAVDASGNATLQSASCTRFTASFVVSPPCELVTLSASQILIIGSNDAVISTGLRVGDSGLLYLTGHLDVQLQILPENKPYALKILNRVSVGGGGDTITGDISGPGGRCGGNINNPSICAMGYHCAPDPTKPNLPMGDVGGICAADNPGGTTTGIIQAGLQFGMRGDTVTTLQTALQAHGYLATDSVTGYFGLKTLTAVKEFQSAHSLPATGYVGAMTAPALSQ